MAAALFEVAMVAYKVDPTRLKHPLSIYIPKSESAFFLFKQKTAYDVIPCDWSSDVCSSDLRQLEFKRKILEETFYHNLPETRGLTIGMTGRSEERRIGKECTVLCRSRWS